MTELLLVRHGQTDSNRSKRFMGQTNVPLNSEGRRQAGRLATRLQGARIDAVYSSDLDRALETARIVGRAVGRDPIARKELREIDVGSAAGKTRGEVEAEHPDLFGKQRADIPFPDGESYAQMTERAEHVLRTVLTQHSGETVLVVTHGGTIRAAVATLARIPLRRLFGTVVSNTSITRLVQTGRSRLLLRVLNDAAHLEPWASSLDSEPW